MRQRVTFLTVAGAAAMVAERGAAEAAGARVASDNPAVARMENALRNSAIKRLCLVMGVTFPRPGSGPVAAV